MIWMASASNDRVPSMRSSPVVLKKQLRKFPLLRLRYSRLTLRGTALSYKSSLAINTLSINALSC